MSNFRDVEILITERLANANQKAKQRTPKETRKIKVYTVICTVGSSPHEGTFRTKKEAINKLKSLLTKSFKRDKSCGDWSHDFIDETGVPSGGIYIVESEI